MAFSFTRHTGTRSTCFVFYIFSFEHLMVELSKFCKGQKPSITGIMQPIRIMLSLQSGIEIKTQKEKRQIKQATNALQEMAVFNS